MRPDRPKYKFMIYLSNTVIFNYKDKKGQVCYSNYFSIWVTLTKMTEYDCLTTMGEEKKKVIKVKSNWLCCLRVLAFHFTKVNFKIDNVSRNKINLAMVEMSIFFVIVNDHFLVSMILEKNSSCIYK